MVLRRFKKILVVDDDEMVRGCIVELLTVAGYEIETAVNGKDGLDKLKASTFDLVISDINMPELNGIGLYLGAVKEHPNLKDKFLFITGNYHDRPKSWPIFFQMSMNIIKKPFEAQELLDSVEVLTRLPFEK